MSGVVSTSLDGLRLERLGVLMEPTPGDPGEAEGVLNPATAWIDGELVLFPRLVGVGNRSRIGRARVRVDDGVPVGVQREGIALEADRGWEHGTGHGGVEDPRITAIPALGLLVMTYVAFGPLGPRVALAVSPDGNDWRRLGPIRFRYDDALGTDLGLFPNKDVVFFPEPVPGPDGRPAIALLHRPMWDLSFAREGETPPLPVGVTDERPSIWISSVPLDRALADAESLAEPEGHRFVAGPAFDWEALKIGAGAPPLRTSAGWLVLHHGVSGEIVGSAFTPQTDVRYAAGAMLLDLDDPSRVIERTARPLLAPETDAEQEGTVGNVVFPTAIEEIAGERYVFYGMADTRIGVARMVGP